jgi:hypothetical protein
VPAKKQTDGHDSISHRGYSRGCVLHYSVSTVYGCSSPVRWTQSEHENRGEKRAWQDSNLRHTAPETVATSL